MNTTETSDGLTDLLANRMRLLGVGTPNRSIWPMDEDYRRTLARDLAGVILSARITTAPAVS